MLTKSRRYFIIFCYLAFVPAGFGFFLILPEMHHLEEFRKIARENKVAWEASPAYPVLKGMLQLKNQDGSPVFSKYAVQGFSISGLSSEADDLGNNYVSGTCHGQRAYFISNGRIYENTGQIFRVFVCADLSGAYYSYSDKGYQLWRWNSLSPHELDIARSPELTRAPMTKLKKSVIDKLYKYHAMPVDFKWK